MDELTQIAQACVTDGRILEVVRAIALMSDEELRSFRSKVVAYFMTRNSPEDNEAYKFYKIVTEAESAKKILEIYSTLTGEQV